jgi:hypothetical protein
MAWTIVISRSSTGNPVLYKVRGTALNLTICLPNADVHALEVKAKTQGVSAEQYVLQVLERDLAPDWLI